MAANPVEQSYLEFKMAARNAYYEDVRQYRDYADGRQATHLTDDQKIAVVGDDGAGNPASDPEFVLNVCAPILDAEIDRLSLKRLAVTVEDNEALSDTLTQLAWDWIEASRMDEGQQNAHFAAARDGNSFGIVEWSIDKGHPIVAINPAYDGQTSGTDVFYEDDDPARPQVAVKIWVEQKTQTVEIRRKNVYYPDRVELWINDGVLSSTYSNAGWRPLREGDKDYDPATVVTGPPLFPTSLAQTVTFSWWTDTGAEGGQPLGLPAHHFRHAARGTAYGRSTIADVVPGLQDAVNRAGIDLLVAAGLAGFKVNWATGINPDQSSLDVYPGAMLYNSDPAGAFGQFGETNLMQLIETKNTYIKDAATLTGTPLSFFNLGGQAPAEGSQKALELALLAKTRRNQTAYGNTWEDIARHWFKLETVFGEGRVPLTWEQIDDLDIAAEWEPAEVKSDLERAQTAEAWERLGVPRKFIWRYLGFSDDEIAEMELEADVKRQQTIGLLAARVGQMEQSPPAGMTEGMRNVTVSGNGQQPMPAGDGAGPVAA